MYGPARLLSELLELGYTADTIRIGDIDFVIIRKYQIEVGPFRGSRDRSWAASYPLISRERLGRRSRFAQIRSSSSIRAFPNVMNIIQSPLGNDWRYWSHNFNWSGECNRSAARLLYKINAIFDRV